MREHSLVGAVFTSLLLLSLFSGSPIYSSRTMPEGDVAVRTDKLCYEPGEPVQITATGWAKLPSRGDFPDVFWAVTDYWDKPVFETFNPADVLTDFNGTLTAAWNQTYRLANDTPPSGEPVPRGMYTVWFYEIPWSYPGWPLWPPASIVIGDCDSNLRVLTNKDCYPPGEQVNISITNGGPLGLTWGIPEPHFAVYDSVGALVKMPGGTIITVPLILKPNETYSRLKWNQTYLLRDIDGHVVPPSYQQVPEGEYVVFSWADWPHGVAGTKKIRILPDCSSTGPTAEAGPDQKVNEGDTVQFDGSGSYDPGGFAGSWSARADIPSPMFNGGSASLGGELYYAGGHFSDVPDWNLAGTFLKYTPANDSWSVLPQMPVNREFPGVAAANGKLYVIGGYNGWFATNTTLEFDPVLNTWSYKTPMPLAAFGFATAVVDDRIYAIGGYVVNCSWCSKLFVYDLATDTWTEKSDMPTPRAYLAAASLGGKVYASGGMSRPPYVDSSTVEMYDPATDIWTKKADMSVPRVSLAAWTYAGRILVLGGTHGWDVLNSTEIYDPIADSWAAGPSMLEPRMSFGSGVIGDCVFAAGGHGRMPDVLNNSEALCPTTSLTYQWDFDNHSDSDGDGNYTNDVDATGQETSWIYGDDGRFVVTLKVTDANGAIDTDTANVTVLNLPPNVVANCTGGGGGAADVYLRIAGEKWHDVRALLYRDGMEAGNASIVRRPGSPNDQNARLGSVDGGSGIYSVEVAYTPEDDPVNGQPNGATPAWIILRQSNGSEIRLHHTFNVRHPETWNWTVMNLEGYLAARSVTCTATATDPGSDDLTFTWDWGDGTPATATTYFNDGIGPDPYPSPGGTFPFTATGTATHAYTVAGTYSIALRMTDDDGGTIEATLVIDIG